MPSFHSNLARDGRLNMHVLNECESPRHFNFESPRSSCSLSIIRGWPCALQKHDEH